MLCCNVVAKGNLVFLYFLAVEKLLQTFSNITENLGCIHYMPSMNDILLQFAENVCDKKGTGNQIIEQIRLEPFVNQATARSNSNLRNTA
ncbi:hypothetical protein LXL04_022733 [Taraxacum kok-saghyz]